MKKIIASLLMAIMTIFSQSSFTVAQSSIKSVINTAGPGNCVDIPRIRITPYNTIDDYGRYVQQFNCNNGINQKFVIETNSNGWSVIKSALDLNTCIGKSGETPSKPSDPVGLYPCRNCSTCDLRPNVMWKIFLVVSNPQIYRFEHAIRTATGEILCLDIPFGTPNAVPLQLYPCHYGNNQSWIFFR